MASAMLPVSLWAQQVNRSKYPDYSDKTNPDPSLMKPRHMSARATSVLPDHVNNALTPYFPPVIDQQGGSCGSASRICYMFSHELNSFRGTNGKDAHNYYPSHFVWLLTNGNSGKDAFVQFVGVPSAQTYGGQTYSKLFGYQVESQNDFGWMTGYDKWYEGMFNRMLKPAHFTESLGTEAGREAVKRWIYNHNGDTDFHSGGIVGIGCASAGLQLADVGNSPANAALGIVGQKYLKAWGTQVDHAMTIVGYDDRIEFDLNGNGIYGEASADERGAWIMVNSWSDTWANQGFVYCPYAYAGASFNANGTFVGNWWTPEVYKVRKNYRPLRTIKLNMDYSRRSELALSVGVAKDVNATEPEFTIPLHHFQYAGDGNYGNTVPAPEVPMLGRWIDGKLHSEPMEFGYDLTDLTDNLDANDALKYFFIINTRNTAQGNGHVYKASVLDYEQDKEGLEVPFETGADGVNIANAGKRTVLTVVVPGRGVKAPQNVAIDNNVLSWSAPQASVAGYKVVHENEVLATLAADVTHYDLPQDAVGSYGVIAMYDGNKESKAATATVMAPNLDYNQCVRLDHTGLTLPGVFTTKYDKATIEFWIRPQSLADWNQSAGPGWGTFMMHANANGAFTAGWDTNNRLNAVGALQAGRWTHVALVVDGNTMTAYINGSQRGKVTSQTYSGLGGFGDLVFSANGNKNDQHAFYDEIRIWRKARTAGEIKADYKQQYATGLLPNDLVAYYRADMIDVNGEKRLRDLTTGERHGVFANSAFALNGGYAQSLGYATTTQVSIVKPTTAIVAGQPIKLSATGSTNIASLHWIAEGAGVQGVACASPVITFKQPGEQQVKVVATDVKGKTVEDVATFNVSALVPADATFKMSKTKVAAGERVSFMSQQMLEGYHYKWTLEGTKAVNNELPYVTVAYNERGTYKVQLAVTDPQGHTATSQQTIEVTAVAPKVDFDVEPAVVMKGETVRLTDRSLYRPLQGQWTLTSDGTIMQGDGLNVSFTPDVPGVYDVTLKAHNEAGNGEATQNRALVVCNADSKTGLSFLPQGSASVQLSKVPLSTGEKYFSIDWWMRPSALQSACNGIGEGQSTFELLTTESGQMRLYVDGKFAKSDDGFVVANEWHHYAVSFFQGSICFYRDGLLISRAGLRTTALPAISTFSLGTADAPMCGTVDEFRVWSNFAFNENKPEELQGYINEPMSASKVTAAQAEGLQVYYKFDQNSGDVKDETSNANTGLRKGFGPDGDAWTNSRGVFSLNFNSTAGDVSSRYLKNYQVPFSNTGEVFNDVYGFLYGNRFMTLSDWKLDNIGNDDKYGCIAKTGACVDTQANKDDGYFTISTGQDGFTNKLQNHKAYQTIDLPEGAYMFATEYPVNCDMKAEGCYLVVAEGDKLPDTDQLSTSLGYKKMVEPSVSLQNKVFFILTEPTTICLGILTNMQDIQQFYIKSFMLKRCDVTPMKGLIDGIGSVTMPDGTITTPSTINAQRSIYDLSGRKVNAPGKGVYIVGGKKVVR